MTDRHRTEQASRPPLTAYGLPQHGVTISDLDRSVRFFQRAFGAEVESTGDFGGEGPSEIVQVPGAQRRAASVRFRHGMVKLVQYLAPLGRPYDRTAGEVGTAHMRLEVDDIEAGLAADAGASGGVSKPTAARPLGSTNTASMTKATWPGLSFYLHDLSGLSVQPRRDHRRMGHRPSTAGCVTRAARSHGDVSPGGPQR